MKLRFWVLLMTFAASAFGQKPAYEFVLNPVRPWVYLKFDHIGPRRPVIAGEPDVGLWLRIVNNCRVPLGVPTLVYSKDNREAVVFDEIIPNRFKPWPTSGSDPLQYMPFVSGVSKSDSPEVTETWRNVSTPPMGYSAPVYSSTYIQPGKELLISVPVNHVGNDWFMRIRVFLRAKNATAGDGPYTDLEFFQSGIPATASGGRTQSRPSM